MLQDLFKNETTIRVIDLFINNIQKSGKLCELYTISFEELLEEINNNTQYKKISVSELKSVLQHLMKFNVIRNINHFIKQLVTFLIGITKVCKKMRIIKLLTPLKTKQGS